MTKKLKIWVFLAKIIFTLLIIVFAVLMGLGSLIFLSGFGKIVSSTVAVLIAIAGIVIILALWGVMAREE
ncbi:MAG: hypothetical protein J1F63_01945 [Oscillospiraceae bacterium]|nr:hypothetical protein [Oscillospiraceae bacterium]